MTDYERIEAVIRFIERNHCEQPRLEELASVAGLSESHFHRLFSRWAGTTPKAFLKFLTAEHAKSLLRESRDLLSVSLDAGLSGPGRLHDLFVSIEGMTPAQYKKQGEGIEIRFGVHESPFGPCLVGITPRGICHLAFIEGADENSALTDLKARWPSASYKRSQGATEQTINEVFGARPGRNLKVHLAGTPFQLKVWEALLRIPQGKLVSYQALARVLGNPSASRAVGTAIGANAIAYLIPCHRVIRETGALGGYRWGLSRKRAILAWEGAAQEPVVGSKKSPTS